MSRDGGIDSVQSVTECDAKEMGMKRGKRGEGGETGKK